MTTRYFIDYTARRLGLHYEVLVATCPTCGRQYQMVPLNDDVLDCLGCGTHIDSRAYSLSPALRAKANMNG